MTRLRSGSGSSTLDDSAAAGRAAASTAATGLQGAEPALVVVYSSIRYDLSALLAGVREVTGDALLVGATSSGQLRDGEFLPPDAGVVVLVMSAGPYTFRTAAVTGIR